MNNTPMDAMRNELLQEAQTTKRLLERVPSDRLTWKPHPKSMTLGQLALHVARIPSDLSRMAQAGEFDVANANFNPPQAETSAEILAALERSLQDAGSYLDALDMENAAAPWRLTRQGNELMAMPRLGMLRALMLNHWYHHRGQLTVYLRLLDVPVPVVYGRTADENPFG